MARPIADDALEQILIRARTHSTWSSQPVTVATLKQLYDLAKLGPTSANCSPMRLVFVMSQAAKERLLPALSKGNQKKSASAPIAAIVAQDRNYLNRLPELFPVGYDARSWFNTSADAVMAHGQRNTMLQAAYLIIAARALGLDCGPMSGFDREAVNAAFFANEDWDAQLVINLGYGVAPISEPRKPRLGFDEACRVL